MTLNWNKRQTTSKVRNALSGTAFPKKLKVAATKCQPNNRGTTTHSTTYLRLASLAEPGSGFSISWLLETNKKLEKRTPVRATVRSPSPQFMTVNLHHCSTQTQWPWRNNATLLYYKGPPAKKMKNTNKQPPCRAKSNRGKQERVAPKGPSMPPPAPRDHPLSSTSSTRPPRSPAPAPAEKLPRSRLRKAKMRASAESRADLGARTLGWVF